MPIIILAIIVIVLFKWYTSPLQKLIRSECKGKTEEQKKVIKYFLDDSFIGSFFKIKDEDYLKMVEEKVKSLEIQKKALNKLGVDEDQVKEITPLSLEGWKYADAYWKKLPNKKYISSSYTLSFICGSEDQIYLYQYSFDMDQDKKKESTNEFFYTDITSVSTSSVTEKTKEMYDKKKKAEASVEIDNESLALVVPGDKMYFSYNNDKDDVSETIKGIQNKIRDKKRK